MESESILQSLKKMLGDSQMNTHFDYDIISYANMAFSTLTDLGVGPENGFSISGYESTWDEYNISGVLLPLVKAYVELKTKLLFDPPANSTLTDIIKTNISELEWRLALKGEEKGGNSIEK